MPVIAPSYSALNLTPSSTDVVSPESTSVGVAKSKIVACGVTASDAADAGPVPTSFVAVTLNV
jgi:type IV pilus biogenesis protein CpaD/CtpE